MVFFNYSTMQMAAKVVYYGPGLCGKTTNLQWIFDHTSTDSRGEMVSLATETDRTLFFDLLPIDVGTIAGFNTRIQLYTVPGQVFYNTTRKLVLKGVDGVVFVADSQRPMLQANIDSFANLEENLAEMGLTLETIPVVLQFNKRDLPNVLSVEELNEAMNRGDWPWAEASAITGEGVFDTLKKVSKATLLALKKRLTKGRSEGGARPGAAPARPLPPKAPLKPPLPPKPATAAGPQDAAKLPLPRAPLAPPGRSGPPPAVPLPKAPPASQPVAPEPAAFGAELPAPGSVLTEPLPAEAEASPAEVPAEAAEARPEAADVDAAGAPALPESEPVPAGSEEVEEEPAEVETEPVATEAEPPVEVEATPGEAQVPEFEPIEAVEFEPLSEELEPVELEPVPAQLETAVEEHEAEEAGSALPEAAEVESELAPAPFLPEPAALEPATPELSAPESAAAELILPEPIEVAPEPAAPELAAPELTLPEPSVLEPEMPELAASEPAAVAQAVAAPPAPAVAAAPASAVATLQAKPSPAQGSTTAALAAVVRTVAEPTPRRKSRISGIDALAELEKLRRQALQPRSSRPASNGKEIRRELQFDLPRGDLQRAHRFSLTLQLEDQDEKVLDEVRRVSVDIEDAGSLEKLLLRFNIALSAKET